MRMRKLAQGATILAAVLAFVGIQVAQAGGSVTITGTDLTGATATWDVQNDTYYGSGGPCFATTGYQPVEDGSYGSQTDAFDGGLLVVVNGHTFNDNDGMGTKSHQQLTVGPTKMSGLRVTRVDTAFSTSPTLRSLVMFKNPTSHSIKEPVLWDSAMGADTNTLVQETSSGDQTFTLSDRWFVASDDNVAPGDPPVTMVMYGRGSVQKPAAVLNAPGQASSGPNSFDSTSCITEKFVMNVPANSTQSLLFFTEMHDTNTTATNAAPKYNTTKPSNKLFDGLSTKVRGTIVNWNL
ncbi:MAG: hypothetical protein QOI81_2086 [Actinomycetota bacterium]|jgi:hypothetical protein|nr:hypothetical protein [Actinomycetota bacterium]